MFRERRYLTIAAVLAVLAVPLIFSLVLRRGAVLAGPGVPAVGVPDTPDARQVMSTMQRAYHLRGVAARTFEVTEFPSVFTDTPDYELSKDQRDLVSRAFGQQVAEDAGYLTYMQAYYVIWSEGATRLQAALDKAKAEGRELTSEEMQSLVKANDDRVPALGRTDPLYEDKLTYESIAIDGDKAWVQYDDGAALQKALLIKVNGQWLIAGIWLIQVHF